jgi:hypothetical protein
VDEEINLMGACLLRELDLRTMMGQGHQPPSLQPLSATHRSTPFVLGSLRVSSPEEDLNTNIVHSEVLHIVVARSGQLHALCMWFDISLLPPEFIAAAEEGSSCWSVNTGPGESEGDGQLSSSISGSGGSSSHFRQAAFLCPNPREVRE